MDRRAYYTYLRMQKEQDPSLEVEDWQVDDYRCMDLQTLFSLLEDQDISLDKQSFLRIAESHETPEQMTDDLVDDVDEALWDRIYLLIFELWRRLVPEKLSLPLFCDELDHQILIYDQNGPVNQEAIGDAFAHFEMVLDENLDAGADVREVFATISDEMANDLESFLFDYISEQIDLGNESFSQELIEIFGPCVEGSKWFEVLKVRLIARKNLAEAERQSGRLVEMTVQDEDLEFVMEVLYTLVQGGDSKSFKKVAKHASSLIETEQDLQDLLEVSADFFNCMDCEAEEKRVNQAIAARQSRTLDQKVDMSDPELQDLFSEMF